MHPADPLTPIECERFRRSLDEYAARESANEGWVLLTPHIGLCDACRELFDRRRQLIVALRTAAGAERVAAPDALALMNDRAGEPGEFVRLVFQHLEPRRAPAELDERVLAPGQIATSPASVPSAPILAFGLSRRSLVRVAAALTVAAGGAIGVRTWLLNYGESDEPQLVIVRQDPSQIPVALRSSVETLAGGLPSVRKG
jgi:hypothetical protein